MPASSQSHSHPRQAEPPTALFAIKSAQLPLVALMVKTGDLAALAQDLLAAYGANGSSAGFFENEAVVIDVSQAGPDLAAQNPEPLLVPLLAALRECSLVPVALRGADAAWQAAALQLGLVAAALDLPRARATESAAEPTATATTNPATSPATDHATESAPPSSVDLPPDSRPEAATRSTPDLAEPAARAPNPTTTLVIDKPLRSGQKIYARGGDLVVLAMVNRGAEVVADGNIHVYAPLRGKAMAGARGNTQARIFSLCMEPELLSIAGVYRTSEKPLPAHVQGQPAQVRLSDDGLESLIIDALKP